MSYHRKKGKPRAFRRASVKEGIVYCPSCFGNSLILGSNGVVDVIVNGKQRDSGRFLFNSASDSAGQINGRLKEKLEDFFKWYSSFNNVEPIEKIELISNNFICSNKCKIDATQKFSVIGKLISDKDLKQIAKDLGQKYGLPIDL